MRIVRIAATLAVPALLAGSLAACGSSAKPAAATGTKPGGAAAGVPALPDLGPKAELIAAAAVMQKAASADITLSSNDGSAGSGSGVYGWSGLQALDLAEQESGKTIKFRLVDGGSYLGVGDSQAAELSGKHWVKLDSADSQLADPFTALAVLINPADELTIGSQSSTLTKVGAEKLGGTDTQHYRSSAQAADLVAKLPNLTDAQRKAALAVASDGGATVISDFWVDAKHQLVQLTETNTDGASPSSSDSSTTVKYADLGVKITVTAPAASDLAAPADAAKLLSSLN
ncbi:hypothetical protein OG455_23495 [Kitasatospora sp. NBC_01287]|uniref:hypothetical protein n=1 Tax=Kitasatospora sp. NBC_01287 TaxID=2903573 RepID=UPI002253BE0C|nr:hypothetical protein [Kitasatospora sp. NBC_01287]MCX4748442.1 hypothetical protein [Kitasatospora sp. NBC_01287]